ncbi:MAG TPA: FAD-dependent oxidoreductase [Vicinamibacterales bacterium]|nr:FAD-dependent oxidoreductase [Vicinamibacterales bacterium]
MRVDADVAIVGSGFAGSLTALALTRRGKRVVVVERGRHPRFAIGESSTPLANLLLEELADAYDLPGIRVFSKWGTWQRWRPDVAGGLKRGFTFYFHRPGEAFADDGSHARQLMVAASPHDDIGDTHWYRPDFDLNLVREAQDAGVVYLDETAVDRADVSGARVSIEAARKGASVRIDADFLVDASGPRGFLARQFSLEAPPRWLPHTEAVYTHFENVARWDATDPPHPANPPYPPDDAALHHIFPGGWIWVLRFNNGVTSAGAAMTRAAASSWDAVLETLPSVRDQFAGARAVAPWCRSPQLAFRTTRTGGRNWALLPSAAGVIDPLLSTGFPLTLLGIHRLVRILADGADGDALREYERVTQAELDATEMLVAALYNAMSDPPLFKKLTLLYFAAASFSEAARRLGTPELAPGFLLHAHPVFGPALHTCCAIALASPQGRAREELFREIDAAIEPFDIAGLRDRSRRDWYPALAEDLIANASKLQATVGEVEAVLERCGFASRGLGRSA